MPPNDAVYLAVFWRAIIPRTGLPGRRFHAGITEQPRRTGGCSQGSINSPGKMSERGLPVGVSVLVELAALELDALFRPGLDRLREL